MENNEKNKSKLDKYIDAAIEHETFLEVAHIAQGFMRLEMDIMHLYSKCDLILVADGVRKKAVDEETLDTLRRIRSVLKEFMRTLVVGADEHTTHLNKLVVETEKKVREELHMFR